MAYLDGMLATRARWAVDRLDVRPDHRLLEIGCGTGAAVALVCERLTTGSVLAIDRSGSAVARATRRNARHLARGVARIEKLDLAELDVAARSFNTVFAVNVNLLATPEQVTSVRLIRRALRPRGRIVLCFEQPSPAHLAARAEAIGHLFAAEGLRSTVTWSGTERVCITATRLAGA